MEKKIFNTIFLISIILVASVMFLSSLNIVGGFLGIQETFILDLNNVSFEYTLTKFNNSTHVISSAEFDFPENGGNETFYLTIPKNATLQNISMNLTGKITTIYTHHISDATIRGISLGDVLGGSELEIVTGSGGLETEPNIYIVNGSDGTILKTFNLKEPPAVTVYSTAVGNLTDDMGNELVSGDEDKYIRLIDISDESMNIIDNYLTEGHVYSVDVGKLEEGGRDVIVAGSGDGYVYVLNVSDNNLSLVWKYKVDTGGVNVVKIGNVTSHSGNEILVGADKLYILNATEPNGSLLWTEDFGSPVYSIDVGNITSYEGNEIAIGTSDWKVYLLNANDTEGVINWSFTCSEDVFGVSIGDVVTDPEYSGNEVVVGSKDKKVRTLDKEGNLIWDFVALSYVRSVVIGDVTDDMGKEVIAGNGRLYVFNFDYFPTNLTIFVDDTKAWNSSQTKLRTTEVATGQNLIAEINNYLDSCTPDSMGNCQVPLVFNSDFKGRLNISDLNVNYTYSASNIITYENVSGWSRISDIKVNESVGSKVYNITFTGVPAENITINYLVVDPSATKCDFNLTAHSLTTISGRKVCDISSNPIFLEGGESITPFSVFFWDDTLETDTPIQLYNTTNYYSTYGEDNYNRQINLTLNATNGTFYNITAEWTLDDSQIKGEEFLKVDWGGDYHDITPSVNQTNCNSSNPTYSEFSLGNDTFYVCRQDTSGDGVIDYFKWKQPELSSDNPTYYLTGGSFNLPADLTNINVTPLSDIWGNNFSFSTNITDADGDMTNITFWVFENQTSTWINKGSENATNGTRIEFNITSYKNLTGTSKFLFEYFDYNSTNSSQIFHSARNTTSTDFDVLKHNISVLYLNESCEGNNSIVFRNETTTLSVFVNDTNSAETVIGANCFLWVNGTLVNTTQTNSTGYCNFAFKPTQTFDPEQTSWKIGIDNDNFYNDENSTELDLIIKEWLSPTILNPLNFSFYKNESTTFSAGLIDGYGNYANLSNYTCYFYLNETFIGTNLTNSSGVCSLGYTPNCSLNVGIKNLSVEISGTHNFYDISDNQTSKQIILRDILNISISSPEEGNYYKGDTLTLNASTKDNCGEDVAGVLINWYLINKYELNLTLKDLSGKNRTNYPIVLNGSFFSLNDFELENWKLENTNISYNISGIPFSLYPWKTTDKSELNESQEYMNNLTELVFLINLSANENKTFEINFKKENPNSYNITYNILNADFGSGNFSFWEVSFTGDYGYYNINNQILNLSSDAPSLGVEGKTTLTQLLPNFTYTDLLQIKYKAWGEFNEDPDAEGEFYIKLGNEVCNLTPDEDVFSEPENWTIINCTNSNFSSARNISIVLIDKGNSENPDDYTYALVDYLCFADENGNCINFHSGEPLKIDMDSKKEISGNITDDYIITGGESVGKRKIVVEAEKQFYDSDKKPGYFNLSGFSKIENLTIDSNFCLPVNSTNYQCMQNASLSLLCKIVDNYTEEGISDYNVSFYNNTSFIGASLTDLDGIANKSSEVGEEGYYNFSCNITDQLEIFYNATEPKEKEISVEVITETTTAELTIAPDFKTAENITIENNFTIGIDLFLNNTGNGTMYDVNINSSEIGGIVIPEITSGPIGIGENFTTSFNITITAEAEPGNNTVWFNATWRNGDASYNSTSDNITIFVEENKRIKFYEDNLTLSIPVTMEETINFTLLNYGNINLTNVTLDLTGADSDTVKNWSSFSNNNFSLDKLKNETINLTFSIPDNNSYIGVYYLNITATIQNCTENCTDYISLILNITLLDWEVSPKNISKNVGLTEEINKLDIDGVEIKNNRNTNFTFNLSIIPKSGTTIDYLTFNTTTEHITQTLVNVTNKSSETIYLYYISTKNLTEGIGKIHNYTLKIENLNESAMPQSIDIPIQLEVINFTIDIISPTEVEPIGDNPSENDPPIEPDDTLEIKVEAKKGDIPVNLSEDINWKVLIGGEECLLTDTSPDDNPMYDELNQSWKINCTAPTITGNPINNTLEVIGNYTEKNIVLSDIEENAVIYKDYTPPQFSNITTSFVNQSDNIPFITFEVNITDNKEIDSVWAKVIYPEGTLNLDTNNYTKSGDKYTFNFSNPNILGDYDITVYANDTTGNPTNNNIGWFDVYLPVQVTGNLTDPDGNKINANFTFYREGKNLTELYKIHENSTETNKTYNWTLHKRKYDVKADLFGQEVILYNVDFNLTENQTTYPFRFDYLPNYTSLPLVYAGLPNTVGTTLLGIIVDTNLTENAYFNLDFEQALTLALNAGKDIKNVNNLEILVCHEWNYTNQRCDSSSTYLDRNLNASGTIFEFSTSNLSAFIIAEACYSDGKLIDCSGYYEPEEEDNGGGTTGGGGTSVKKPVCGNGICETGENWQNCPSDCPIEEFPLIIDTNIGEIRIFPGESKTYWISLENKLIKEVEVDLEITEGLQDLLSLSSNKKIIQPNAIEKLDINLVVPNNKTLGTYAGNIIVKAEGQKQNIPVTIPVLESAAAFYSIEVEIATKVINPGGNLDFVVKLTNLGERVVLPINLTYIIKDQKTDKIIREIKTNTTLETTTIVRESLSLNITEEGSYTLEVWADYKEKSIMDVATFEIVKPLFESPLTLGLLLLALVMGVAVGGTYLWKYYRVWKAEKEKEERYLYPLNYRKVPREGFKIGKFAGTNNYCYYNPKDLTTHLIAAGATGAGKSVSASVFAEEALDKKIPVVAFDPTAQWTGFVRSCKDSNLLRKYKKFDMNEFDIKSYPGLIFDVDKPDFKLNVKEFVNPGEITVFCLNKLKPGEYDEAVRNIIDSIFRES